MSPIPEPFVHHLRVRYAECDAQGVVYRAPARFDDELDIAVTVTRLGTTSMTTRHRMTRAADGEPVSDARLRYVWVDVATHASTPIPEWARDALAPYLVPDVAPVAPSAGA